MWLSAERGARPAPSPPTAATCAATPRGWPPRAHRRRGRRGRRRRPRRRAAGRGPGAGVGGARPRRGALAPPLPRRRGPQRPSTPPARWSGPAVPRGLPKALTEEQIGRLLAAPVGDDPIARRDRAILEVLYATGLRVSELVGLSLGDVDLDASLLRAFGKGSKERIVPVGGHATRALVAWLAPEGRDAGAGALASPRRRRRGVPQRPGRPAHPPGRLGHPAPSRRAGRAPGPAQPRMCCATRAPPTCSTTAPTSGPCRSCWGTRRSAPRRCTRRSPPSGCGRSTDPLTHARPLQH